MKIHPDGTLEGTAEELAAYQSKVKESKVPNLWGQHPKPIPLPTPLEAHGIPGRGQQVTGGCIYISQRTPNVTFTFNQT